jgi:putative ABC transport system substrate-binding protein
MVGKGIFYVALWTMLFALCPPLEAQPKQPPRIGYLTGGTTLSSPGRLAAFRQGLRELGYVEGKSIVIDYRYAEGKPDRLAALAAELVRLKVDVILTTGSAATRIAKEATSSIPIVMAQDPDPVGSGFVASLAQPGGNITGLSSLRADLSGKRLELLREILPKISRVAVLGTSTNPPNVQFLKETEVASKAFGVQLQYLDILSAQDIESAFRTASNGRSDAILLLGGPIFNFHRTRIVDLTAKNRLPAMYDVPEYVEAGGLMSYGTNINDLSRRAATYVDKIVKGAKPADLPVEQPTKFEFVVNLKAAKQIALTIPPNVLARADRVIK